MTHKNEYRVLKLANKPHALLSEHGVTNCKCLINYQYLRIHMNNNGKRQAYRYVPLECVSPVVSMKSPISANAAIC